MNFHSNGLRAITQTVSDAEITFLKSEWHKYVASIPAYPENRYKGKGIVYTAGGISYVTCSWVAISMLRKKGCTLPIELWYSGNEISPEICALFETLNVVCKNFSKYINNHVKGFISKPLAILYSSFKEVLFLDADNVCYGDPHLLFEDKDYLSTGALFWPDYWFISSQNPIWDVLDISPDLLHEQESGQILIDKEKSWEPLQLCIHLNQMGKYYYKMIYGDKDTFKFAWLALKRKFHMIDIFPSSCGRSPDENTFYGNTMVQYSPNGELLFLHRNLLKWDITHLDEHCWQTLKSFKPDSQQREIVFLDHPDGLLSIDLQGDVESVDFREQYGKFEELCLFSLMELRATNEFNAFMAYSHFAIQRYSNGTGFVL